MRLILARLVCAGLSCYLAGCTILPSVENKVDAYTGGPSNSGVLADAAASINARLQQDGSAFLLVPAADEAMNWRLALIDTAVESIDAQYFIWKDDASGSLMLEHLLAAADRGVKVRLLVDDMFLSTGGAFKSADDALAALDYHPNIQLRLFNPGKYRNGIAGLAGNFGGNLKHYNRRMHNKLMMFDGHFAIMGGRNIGDEYFGLLEGHNFLDLDVLVAGGVIAQAAKAYDTYWNAEMSYPAENLAEVSAAQFDEMRLASSAYVEEQATLLASYIEAQRDWTERISLLPTAMAPGYAAFLQDEPVQRGGQEYRLYSMLEDIAQAGGEDLIISTPYLIPVGSFLQQLADDVDQGVQTRVLTNSLGSNDATAAHSHYKKYRGGLLDTGASLYEFQHEPSAEVRGYADVAPQRANFIGLHMKASSIDGQRCFIGSLNIDPRSVEVNTENGLYIDSPGLCGELHAFMELMLQPANVWQVSRDSEGKLQYTSEQGTTSQQPAQGSGQRMADFFFRLLPLESQL